MLELPLALEDEPRFILDGRTISFPEGLRTAGFTHTLHRFPGKFVPQVARELIRLTKVAPGRGLVADPFCGSGTTLVEAATMGIDSLGADLDPLGALISRVKTTPLSTDELATLSAHWRDAPLENGPASYLPEVKNLSHWFTPSCLSQLAAIKAHCSPLPPRLRDFSLVVFSSIIRRVSNADDQTQKTYVSGTLLKRPPAPRDLFPALLSRAVEGMAAYAAVCLRQPQVVQSDARTALGASAVQGIATSPPYLDSIDYIYNQMLEYFWLHKGLGLSEEADIRAFRARPMGFARGSVQAIVADIRSQSPALADALSDDLAAIEPVSRKEAEHVAGYFRDYAEHLRLCRSVMDGGARYVLAVGESVVRGRRIATPDLLAHVFEAQGFHLVGRCAYEIKRHYMKFPRRSNSGTIKLDHILCFEAQ